jgi:GntR family transcriptional regulator
MTDWDDKEPIYVQLAQSVLEGIMRGALSEGQPVPSVRQVASQERINPLTVSRGYQLLVDDGLLEKRRGLGMFVAAGARQKGMA